MTEPAAPPAEPAPEATPEPVEPVKPEPDEPFDETRAKEKIRKANSEAENLRKRLKEMEPLAQEAQQLRDAKKSETEKLSEQIGELQPQAANALRFEIALDKGLTKSQAKRLVGTTREELEADADELLADLGATRPTPTPGKPRERLRGGGDPEVEPVETDPRKLADLVPRNTF